MSIFSKKSLSAKRPPAPPPSFSDARRENNHWSLFEEGQLLIDMYDTDDTIVVRSFVAGVEPESIEISMHNDMLTIRGSRHDQAEVHDDRFYHRECHWGAFSRSLIIPKPVDASRIRALFKHGVLTILLPTIDVNSTHTAKGD